VPKRIAALTAALMTPAMAVIAEPPVVVADIAPVHSLVARVMAGFGEPIILVPPGTSPHHFALRPTDARALSDAELVVVVGSALDPRITEPIAALANEADTLELFSVAGTTVLEFRENAAFESDDEHHGDDAPMSEAESHEHHGRDDPHAWLDPQNAMVWLDAIAAELTALDPANGQGYADNAAAARRQLVRLIADVEAELQDVKGQSYIVFHDAFQYFERRFGVPASGAIAIGDASQPSADRIRSIRATIASRNVTCVFKEPQHNAALVSTVLEGSTAGSGTLDPIGATIEPGPALYPRLIRTIATSMRSCMSGTPVSGGAMPPE